ncbi:formate dehydrogenase accessory sulfurtransferase FdhD [Clostridium taeniosporum]|uniref:Sulfur carrier protein FdhD n=1 Tax=Clostridium taeniosporum TaxID=394958 RepID=A0A1D7XNA6_9CLOT|nr:formate dehydrogenase accessory sulfurtransferase FdhD [Clostridium taeniosporum]AOR24767.1 sulfurtransferase FdhD [Clostridium taeniosporum]
MDKVLNCNAIKIKKDEVFEVSEILVREYALSIFLNSKKLATLFCSPEKFEELTIGFLRTEGIINSKKDIINLNIDEANGVVDVKIKNLDNVKESVYSKKVKLQNNSVDFFNDINCKPVDSNITLESNKVFEFMKKNLDYSEVFKTTGGVHCVALCDTEDIRVISEDVARHNALDKVIGEALIKDISLKDKIIILSGRVSLEMILKAAKLQIPIIISKSAPTSLSLELAKRLNITLIGFVRGNKMNIYANKQRILF